jgi:hypothetical protein
LARTFAKLSNGDGRNGLVQRYIGRKRVGVGRKEGRKKGRVKNDVKKELEGIVFLLVLNLVERKELV